MENWTISNIYINVPPNDESVAGEGSFGIFWNGGNNTAISGNTIHDAKWCIIDGYPPGGTTQNVSIFANTEYDCDHGIAVYSDDPGAILDNLYLYGNTIHDAANWDDTADNNHHDGIHISPVQSSAQMNTAYLYNNYIYGDFGTNRNSFMYEEQDGSATLTNVNLFNNVLVNSSATHTCANGLIQDYGSENALIANNALVGPTNGAGTAIVSEESAPYQSVIKTTSSTHSRMAST